MALSKVLQTASYAIMAVGLFLLFFLGARAFGQITDPAQVQGRPRQQGNRPGFGVASLISTGLVDSTSSSPIASAAGSPVPAAANKSANGNSKNENSAKPPEQQPDTVKANQGMEREPKLTPKGGRQ